MQRLYKRKWLVVVTNVSNGVLLVLLFLRVKKVGNGQEVESTGGVFRAYSLPERIDVQARQTRTRGQAARPECRLTQSRY